MPEDQDDLHARAWRALMSPVPADKAAFTGRLFDDWGAGRLVVPDASPCPVLAVDDPGRPERPELIAHTAVVRRKPVSPEGRAALLHAIAHIEFNAINLALDCVYRFRGLPAEFYADWLRVAAEEAYHFGLLSERLDASGFAYGDFPAHRGLWDMAVKTAADPLARMALVPRVLEARGLDATPPIIASLRRVGDEATIAVLDIILRDEIGHVEVGNRWYKHLCQQQALEPVATARQLALRYRAPAQHGPFNLVARLQAGFSASEIARLEGVKPQKGSESTKKGWSKPLFFMTARRACAP